MVWAGIGWVALCYVKLLMHYVLEAYEERPWRALPKTLLWGYLVALVGVLVAYLFEVFCWVVLGAVSGGLACSGLAGGCRNPAEQPAVQTQLRCGCTTHAGNACARSQHVTHQPAALYPT